MDGTLADAASLPFETLARSALGGPAEPGQAVISDEEELRRFFEGDPPPHPQINFSRSTLVVVAMGTQRSSGHSIEITGIQRTPDGATLVRYAEKHPEPGRFVSHIMTAPFHAVLCSPRIEGPVTFARE